jgi:putative ABC transport system ATP-binding protein
MAQEFDISSDFLMDAIIQLNQVVKQYLTPAGPFIALRGIDAAIYRNEFVGVFGKSGAGKTTLVNMITGIDTLTSGNVIVAGVSAHELTENDRSLWRGKNLGVVFQNFFLMPTLNLLDNVLIPMDFCGLHKGKESINWAMHLLREVELAEHAYKLPSQISGGQQQRVAIARALANDPPIIVADEPTGRLDSVTAETVFNVFQRLVDEGKTILMVTHDTSLAGRMSRFLTIVDGSIMAGNDP